MEILLIALKMIVGLSIINVWTLNKNKASQWRGGNSNSIFEEFDAYGLPRWSVYLVGTFKVGLSLLLLLSIPYEGFTQLASLGLALFLSGSVAMHLKIKDPLKKSFPAILFLVLSIVIFFLA